VEQRKDLKVEQYKLQLIYKNYVIKFVSNLGQVGGFLGTPVSSTNTNDCHDIAEILLKVALNTITITPFLDKECVFCVRKPPTCPKLLTNFIT
jgi:hypothetical protein